jgi:hypothetical protein
VTRSDAKLLFLFDQMIDLDLEFREESVDQVSSWMFQTTILDFQHLLQTGTQSVPS